MRPKDPAAPRPLYWSVRRELWENRFLYRAPLVVTVLVLLGTSISVLTLPRRMQTLASLDAEKQHLLMVQPFAMAPAPIMFATFLVGLFYCLDALYGERRDRSILFWKSLPVSDLTIVLSKAAVPLVVLPLIALGLSLATVAALLALGTVVLPANGISPARLWGEVRFFQEPLIMVYGLAVHALWFAPLYGWLLLISAWARRTPLLWVVLPPFVISVVEGILFGSSRFASLLGSRVTGAMREAFTPGHRLIDRLDQLDPLRFLGSPGLWSGLAVATAFLLLAVRMRRNREPI